MKNCTLLFLLFFMITPGCLAQQLSKEASQPRSGDVLYKIQQDYTTSGAKGSGVVWDFRTQKADNDTYRVGYTGKIDSVLCLSESRTQYKYRLSTDSLLLIGYENVNARVDNRFPMIALRYPFAYGDSISSYFYGEGSYSHSLGISSYGFSSVVADGLGCLLLPDTDTLRQVLRVRRDQYIGQTYYANRHSTPCIDSIPHLSDTIQVWLQRDPATWHVVHCQWYAPGYRYPVFETFENSIYKSGILHKHFNTSFYYPLTEQQYLKDDPENRAIREQLAVVAEKTPGQNSENNPSVSRPGYRSFLLDYTLVPGKQLTLNYQMNEPVQLEVILTTVSGIVIHYQSPHIVSAGGYSEKIDVSQSGDKEFILSTIVNGTQESRKIM